MGVTPPLGGLAGSLTPCTGLEGEKLVTFCYLWQLFLCLESICDKPEDCDKAEMRVAFVLLNHSLLIQMSQQGKRSVIRINRYLILNAKQHVMLLTKLSNKLHPLNFPVEILEFDLDV